MKLKKIASLMLAGIMAVSMLAGCNGNTPEEGDDTNKPVTPVASGLNGYVNDLLSTAEEKIITFEDNSTLDTALNAVALDAAKVKGSDIKDAAGDYTWIGADSDTWSDDVVGKFTSGNYFTTESNEWRDWKDAAPANAEKTDTYSFVEVKLLDGRMTDEAVAEAVHAYWGNVATTQMNSINSTEDVDIVGSVSAVRVSNSADDSTSAWVVAVMVTKTVTKTANTAV